MDQRVDFKKFRIYKLKGQEVYFAVPKDYWAVMDYELTKHGNLANVPSDKSVRGIFFNKTEKGFFLNEASPQNDVVINQLAEIAL